MFGNRITALTRARAGRVPGAFGKRVRFVRRNRLNSHGRKLRDVPFKKEVFLARPAFWSDRACQEYMVETQICAMWGWLSAAAPSADWISYGPRHAPGATLMASAPPPNSAQW